MKSSQGPRVLFFGYSLIGVECLRALVEAGFNICGVVTHGAPSDEPFPTVEAYAQAQGLPVTLVKGGGEEELIPLIHTFHPELILSVYFKNILPSSILKAPRLGAYNLHGSLLPKYRGRAPLNWAIVQGETETGVTLHHMVERVDAGDIVAQQVVPIGPDETAGEVFVRMSQGGAELLIEMMPALLSGTAPHIPMDLSQAKAFPGRRPSDGAIDWSKSAQQIHNLIRAVAPPFPGAFSGSSFIYRSKIASSHFPLKPGECLRTSEGLFIGCGEGTIKVLEGTGMYVV